MATYHRNPNGVNPLKLGIDQQGEEVTVSDASLLNNGLLIIGSKNTGKSDLIPDFFQQEIIAPFTDEDGKTYYPVTNACIIVITAQRNQSYDLYCLGRKLYRPAIRLLKPSTNFQVKNNLLGMEEYNYDKINQIIDFVHALQEKEAVLIDMEVERYGDAAIQAVGMLLMQLQIAIHNTAATNKRRTYLIIDDAFQYLPYLEVLLRYGSEYNLSTVLIFDSRKQYEKYQALIETNIQNYLIMSNLYYDDAEYFSKRFLLDSPRELIGQGKQNCYAVIFDDNMNVKSGQITLQGVMSEHDRELMHKGAAKYKKQLDKQGGDEEYTAVVMKAYAQYVVQANQRFKTGTWANAAAQAVAKRSSLLAHPQDNPQTNLIQRTTGAVAPPKHLSANSAESAPPKQPDKNDNEDTTITTHLRKQPAAVGAPTFAKKKTTANPSGAGMSALLGAVQTAPPRIKERLAEKGITEESVKQIEKLNNNVGEEKPVCDKKGESKPNKTEQEEKLTDNDKAVETHNSKADIGQQRGEKHPESQKSEQAAHPVNKKPEHHNPQQPNEPQNNAGGKKKKKKKKKNKNVEQIQMKEVLGSESVQPQSHVDSASTKPTHAQATTESETSDAAEDTSKRQEVPEVPEIPSWIDDLDGLDDVGDGMVLDLDPGVAEVSNLPKSADESFNDETQKFLKMMQNQGSRPSFFSHRKEIQEMEKSFNKKHRDAD